MNVFKDVVTSEAGAAGAVRDTDARVAAQGAARARRTFPRVHLALAVALDGDRRPGRRCDVSPKGDAPGFVLVLDDHRLVIPDRPGNKRLDGMRNLLANPHVGLIFLVPGREETLRVNGRAWITRDPEILRALCRAREDAGAGHRRRGRAVLSALREGVSPGAPLGR